MSIHDAYRPVIGTTLGRISISACRLEFEMDSPDNSKKTIMLESMADFCVKESQLFRPYSEYDTFEPEMLAKLYSYLDQPVISFRPLGRNRACRMEFPDGYLYSWARECELPKNLFDAFEINYAAVVNSWGIDDA